MQRLEGTSHARSASRRNEPTASCLSAHTVLDGWSATCLSPTPRTEVLSRVTSPRRGALTRFSSSPIRATGLLGPSASSSSPWIVLNVVAVILSDRQVAQRTLQSGPSPSRWPQWPLLRGVLPQTLVMHDRGEVRSAHPGRVALCGHPASPGRPCGHFSLLPFGLSRHQDSRQFAIRAFGSRLMLFTPTGFSESLQIMGRVLRTKKEQLLITLLVVVMLLVVLSEPHVLR